MGGKSKAPAAPNYQPIADADEQAAQLQAQTAAQQMAWSQQQFATNQNELAPLISEETAAAGQQNQQAQASYDRYTKVEEPLQNQYLTQAENYANPAYQQQQAGQAIANVGAGYTGARNTAQQQLQAYGADPGTARATAANTELGSQQAAAEAAAGTTSTQNTRLTGLNLESNAENMMAGLPGQSTAEYGGANSAGSTASGNALGLTASGAATEGTAPQYYGLQSNSLNNWGNTLATSYNDELSRAEYDNQLIGSEDQGYGQFIGSVIGGIASAAKGGTVPAGYAHGGMAIPDNVSYRGGGPIMPRGVPKIPTFHVTANHMKVRKPIQFHLSANSHPHTASVGPGGTPRMSMGSGMRGMGAGMNPGVVTPGSSRDGGVPMNIDSGAAGLGAAGGKGGGNGASSTYGLATGGMARGLPVGGTNGDTMALASGGALPVEPNDPHGRADDVPVKTHAGAYVVPKSVVDKKGTHFFDKIIAEHGTPEEQRAAHLRLQGLPVGVNPQAGNGNTHIMMSGGEFMIPKSVVSKLGSHHFDKIAAKDGDRTDRIAAELRLQGQQAGAGNGPPPPANQLRGAIPKVDLKSALPMGAR